MLRALEHPLTFKTRPSPTGRISVTGESFPSDTESAFTDILFARLPDASVPHEVVAKDIHDMASAGAGGLEFLAFELYSVLSRLLLFSI